MRRSSESVAALASALARLPDRRDRQSPAHGGRADLRSPLCLFTLVGIAGEDDLDASDLCDGPLSSSAADRSFRPMPCVTLGGNNIYRWAARRLTSPSLSDVTLILLSYLIAELEE